MTDTADRVAMRFGEIGYRASVDGVVWFSMNESERETVRKIAAALSSHGLRKAVEKIEHGIAHQLTSCDKIYLLQQVAGYHELLLEIRTALLGEGETLKNASNPRAKDDPLCTND